MPHTKLAMLSLVVVVSNVLAVAAQDGPQLPDHRERNYDLPASKDPAIQNAVAMCVIDVAQAAMFLGQAGTAINAASKACLKKFEGGKSYATDCGSPAAQAIETFTYMGSFIAGAAKECAIGMQLQDKASSMGLGWVVNNSINSAQCAQSVEQFIAAMAQIAQAGMEVSAVCGKTLTTIHNNAFDARRLASAWPVPKGMMTSPARKQDEADCSFDVVQATVFLARAGSSIFSSVTDCSDYNLFTHGREAKATCASVTSEVIMSFSFITSMLAYAVSHCPKLQNVASLCAAGVADLIAGSASLAASGAEFQNTCMAAEPEPRRLDLATANSDLNI